jgi:hypothetical protein
VETVTTEPDFNDVEFLTRGELQRLIKEILESAGPEGLPEDKVRAAIAQVEEMVLAEATMQLWRDGKLQFGWKDGELAYRGTEKS